MVNDTPPPLPIPFLECWLRLRN